MIEKDIQENFIHFYSILFQLCLAKNQIQQTEKSKPLTIGLWLLLVFILIYLTLYSISLLKICPEHSEKCV
jgi:hypothetical protein